MTSNADPSLPIAPAQFGGRDWLVLLVTPLLGWWGLQINLFVQNGYLDPWLYTGVGQVFEQLVETYSWAYYFIRFPATFLLRVFCMNDAPDVGYLLLRYALIIGVGGALYTMALRQFGRAAAVAGYLFLFCNPLFLRVITWDLTPFLSVPFAMAGAALWLYDVKSGYWRNLAAGTLFCLSFNSHIFTVSAIGCIMAGAVGAHLIMRRPLGRLGWQLLAAATGFVATWLAGWGYYEYLIGQVDPLMFWKVNILAMSSGSNYALVNARPFVSWAALQTYCYVPFLWLVAMLVLWRPAGGGRAGYCQWAIAIAAAGYGTFYLLYRFVLGRFVIEEFYYFGHIWAIFPLVVPLVVAHLAHRTARQWGMVATMIAIMLAMDFVLIAQNQGKLTWLNLVYGSKTGVVVTLLAAAAGVTVIRLCPDRFLIRLAGFAVFCMSMQVLSVLPNSSREVYGMPDRAEQRQIYRAAVQFAHIWKNYARSEHAPNLWYRNSATDPSISSVGYVVLGDTLHDKWDGPGMPQIGAYEMQRLTNVTVRCVMLMAKDRAEIEAGKTALAAAGLKLHAVDQITISDGTLLFHVEIVQCTKLSVP